MKCVGNDMQQDKSRATEFAAPIQRTPDQSRVKLLFREIVQVGSCRFSYPVFGNYQSGHRWAIFFVLTKKTLVLKIMYPSFLTGQNVHKLFPNGRLANPEISLCWSASGTVVTWCSKRSKRLCIVLCNSMIPDLVNMISLYRFDTTFNNVRE